MHVTSVTSTQPCRAPSREQPKTPVYVWKGTEIVCHGFRPSCCDTGSSSHFTKLVTSSDPHGPSVTDPCLTRHRRWSHPHAHHTLACSSTGKDELSRCWRWSDTHTCTTRSLASPLLCAYIRFLLASRAYFSCLLLGSLARFLLASLLPPWLSFTPLSSSERSSNSFYICGPSQRAQSAPSSPSSTRTRPP